MKGAGKYLRRVRAPTVRHGTRTSDIHTNNTDDMARTGEAGEDTHTHTRTRTHTHIHTTGEVARSRVASKLDQERNG